GAAAHDEGPPPHGEGPSSELRPSGLGCAGCSTRRRWGGVRPCLPVVGGHAVDGAGAVGPGEEADRALLAVPRGGLDGEALEGPAAALVGAAGREEPGHATKSLCRQLLSRACASTSSFRCEAGWLSRFMAAVRCACAAAMSKLSRHQAMGRTSVASLT